MRSPLSPWYHNLQQRCEEAEAILEKLSPEPPLQPVWKLRQQLYDLYDMYWDEASARHEELKESQLALQAALDKYVALYDFAPVGYLTLDDNGAILEANLTVARLLGIDRRDLIGQLLYAYLPDRENKDAFYLHCNRAMATGRLEGCDVTIQRRDGTQLIARLDSCFNARQHLLHTALSDVTARCQIEAELQAARDEGEVLRAAHDALERQVLDRTEALQRANAQLEREIAERKGLEAQVLQAEKMQAVGSLAGGIAHEFNNVLSVIMGYTDLLQDEVRYYPTALEYAQEVQQASQRLQEFVQQILAYSRSDSVASEPAPLSEVVNDILGFLRRSLPATIELGAYIEAEVQSASVRRTPLFQVLMNLCSNAEHAMRDAGGRLIIDAAASHVDAAFAARHPPLRPGSHVRITVRDTGMGIEPEMLPRIFDPFFTTKEVGEGTGMGLAIVHGVVSKQEGAVTVASTPGAGTTFAIYLPQLDAPAPLASLALRNDAPAPVSAASGRLLVVDDEAALLRATQGLLARHGYDVVTAASGMEALERFQAEPHGFDGVITDYTMPGMTGVELIRSLRLLRADIPAILCTGFSHALEATSPQALGVDALMLKPVDIAKLVEMVQQLLKARQSDGTQSGQDG